jgi:two-component system, sensor histidine kinase and response regulator
VFPSKTLFWHLGIAWTPDKYYSCHTPATAPLRLLITDDNEDNRLILKEILALIGFEIKEAASGRQCLDIAPIWQPHLIFMDLRMSGLDGLETTRLLRAQSACATVPIIAVSASTFIEDQEASLAAGCQAYLSKPIRIKQLFEVLAHFLALTWDQ